MTTIEFTIMPDTDAEHLLRPVMLQLVSSARAYRSIALWRETMSSLTHRLNLTLG